MRTAVGYTGGKTKSPTYESVCRGDGHTEAMRVWFDSSQTSYEAMLEVGGQWGYALWLVRTSDWSKPINRLPLSGRLLPLRPSLSSTARRAASPSPNTRARSTTTARRKSRRRSVLSRPTRLATERFTPISSLRKSGPTQRITISSTCSRRPLLAGESLLDGIELAKDPLLRKTAPPLKPTFLAYDAAAANPQWEKAAVESSRNVYLGVSVHALPSSL